MKILDTLQQKIGLIPAAGPGSAAILAAIGREMRARKKIFLRAILVPDQYRVELSRHDFQAIKPLREMFCRELQEEALGLVQKENVRISGHRIGIKILHDPELAPKKIRVTGSFSTPSQAMPGAAVSDSPDTPTVRLVIAFGTDHEETRELTPGSYLIGRGRDADIFPLVEDTLMSRNHCLLTISGQEIILQDLDSGNGVVLEDNQQISHTRLHRGDRFLLGNTSFIVQL
jgi:hypothetical protein